MKKANSENQTLTRLIAFNAMLVILVTVIPIIVYYQYFHTSYDSEIENLNVQKLEQLQNEVDETILKKIIDIPNQYLSDLSSNEMLIYPFTNDITHDSQRQLDVIGKLDDIQKNNGFLDSIDLYYRNNHILFMGTEICFLQDTGCQLGYRQDWINRINNTNLNVEWMVHDQNTGGETDKIISYIRSIPYFGTKETKQGAVAVNLDAKLLDDTIAKLKPTDSGEMAIIDDQGNFVAKTSDKVSSLRLPVNSDEGHFRTNFNGSMAIVTYAKSQYAPWRYVSIMSLGDFYQKSNQLTLITILIGMAFLLVNLAFSLLMTRKAHKPIGTRLHQYSSQIENLRQHLDKNRPMMRHHYILGLLTGKNRYEREDDNRKVLEVAVEKPKVFAFVIRLLQLEESSVEHELLTPYYLMEMLAAGDDFCSIWPIKDEEDRILGLANFDSTILMSEVVRRLSDRIEKGLQSGYVLAIGTSYDLNENKNGIADSYKEACEALQYAFLQPDNKLITYDSLNIAERKSFESPVKAHDEIEGFIRSGQEELAQNRIEKIVLELITGKYTVENAREVLFEIVAAIRKAVGGMGLQADDVFGYDIREHFHRLDHVAEFARWIRGIVHIAESTVNDRKHQMDHGLDAKIQAFIEENLYNQISLEAMSDHLSLSSGHLSRLFRMMYGVTFTEYITSVKLEHAAKLLTEGSMTVQDAASKLGYNTTHHFIRIFKEKFGVTPKKYQIMHTHRNK